MIIGEKSDVSACVKVDVTLYVPTGFCSGQAAKACTCSPTSTSTEGGRGSLKVCAAHP